MKNRRMPAADILVRGMIILFAMLAGCGRETDMATRFKMEKMLSDADKFAERVRVKGPELTDQDFAAVIEKYSRIPSKVPPARDMADVQAASAEKRQAWALASLALTRIGTLYLDRRQNDVAFDTFKSVYDSPSTTDLQKNAVVNYMAICRERSGRYRDAAALYDSLAIGYLAVIMPQNPNFDALDAPIKAFEMWQKAGDQERSALEMDRARAYYSQIKSKYPGTAMESAAIGKIAATYLRQTRFAEAIEVLKAVKDDSTGYTSARMLSTIGEIYLNDMNDYRGAEETYRQLMRYYPEDAQIADARLGLALSLFEQERYPEARDILKDIEKQPGIDRQKAAQGLYLVALCFDREDKWELAKGQFDIIETAFNGSDESFESVLYIAGRYRSKGQESLTRSAFEDALNFINRYAQLNANNPVARSRALGYLVRAYTENGDLAQAAEQLAKLHEQFPQLPEGKFAPLRLGDLYENVFHDTAKAVYWLEIFVRENPDAENVEDLRAHIAVIKK